MAEIEFDTKDSRTERKPRQVNRPEKAIRHARFAMVRPMETDYEVVESFDPEWAIYRGNDDKFYAKSTLLDPPKYVNGMERVGFIRAATKEEAVAEFVKIIA